MKFKKILLFLPILLILSSIYAHTFDFELTESIVSSKNLDDRIKAWYDFNNQEWQVFYTATDKVIYAKLFDSSWVNTDSDSFDCAGTGCFSDASDYNYINGIEGTYWYILTDENSGDHDAYILNYSFVDSAFTTLDTEYRANQIYAVRVPAVSNRYEDDNTGNPLLLWDNLDGLGVRDEDLRYTLADNLGGVTFSGDGKFDLPSTYETPDDVQVVWCNDAYHVIVEKDGGLFDITYDDDTPYTSNDYKNIYSLSPGLVLGSISGWGIESIDNFLYVAVVGNLTIDKGISLQQWECNDDFTITPVYNEVFYQNYVHHSNEFDTQSISNNILWYQFKEADGLLDDSSPNSYSGTVYDATYQTNSLFDYGMDFGSGSYVDSGVDLSIAQNDEYSLSAWIKTTSNDEMFIVGNINSTNDGGYQLSLENGYVYITSQESNGDSDKVHSNITVNDGDFHFIVVSDSGTDVASEMEIYIDGIESGIVVDSEQGVGNFNSNINLFISNPIENFIGTIDEVGVWDKVLNSTEISLLYEQFNQNIIYQPYLTRDEYGTYYLFYDGTTDLFVSYEDPCVCNDWFNTTICVEDKIKQTRTCNPDLCQDSLEERYVDSLYCEKEYNRTQGIYNQGFEKWYSQNSCETDWVYVGEGVAECSPNPITINPNCINVTSKLEVIPEFDTYHTLYGYSEGCVRGEYYLTSCNPSYDCFQQNYSCYQLNISQEDYYDYYISGDIVTGKGSMYVDNVCKCKWGLFNFGIRKFKLRVASTVTCDIACEEKWTCINEDYKGLIHIDCSQTNVTFCDYGCVDGVCVSLAESETEISAGYWFNKFFNPDKTMKFFYSFFFSLVVGVIGLALGKMFDKNNKHGGILFMVFFGVMFSFFALVTWIPPLIIIMIIFFVLTLMGLKAIGK